jgi:hypothetical protein
MIEVWQAFAVFVGACVGLDYAIVAWSRRTKVIATGATRALDAQHVEARR